MSSDRHCRLRTMAIAAATTQAATMAMPFGRVAVPIAAATPASTHCSRSRNNMQAAAQTMSAASAYDHDSTTEPGNRANSTIARCAVAMP